MATFHLSSTGRVNLAVGTRGAGILRLETPNRSGEFGNIALTDGEAGEGSYAGLTLAPAAGRIRRGELCLSGLRCNLDLNDGANHLHGGRHNLSLTEWQTDGVRQEAGMQSIVFTAHAADGLDGYPGERDFQTTYRLHGDGALDIEYRAATDKPTYVDMSCHAYWNLSDGHCLSGLEQMLQLNADSVCLNDAEHLPRTLTPVEGTAFDFRVPMRISDAMARDDQGQFAIGRGYNNAFASTTSQPVACLWEPLSGRRLRLYAQRPSLVLYSGGFLPQPGLGIALESQNFPDAPHSPWAECRLLTPNQIYSERICFRFDTLP